MTSGCCGEVASRLLTEEGSVALTLRQVVADVGCSTTVLYTLFGDKDGLAEALCREGFDRFRRHLANLPPAEDRVSRLYDTLGRTGRARWPSHKQRSPIRQVVVDVG